MSFAEQLKRSRIARGLTQQQVADKMGITNSTYCGYETGKRQPDVAKIKQLAIILNTSGDILLETGFSTVTNASQNQNNIQLSVDEEKIIKNYRNLNREGQENLVNYSDVLVSSGKYKRNIKNNPLYLGKEA